MAFLQEGLEGKILPSSSPNFYLKEIELKTMNIQWKTQQWVIITQNRLPSPPTTQTA